MKFFEVESVPRRVVSSALSVAREGCTLWLRVPTVFPVFGGDGQMRRYDLHDDQWERIKDLLPGHTLGRAATDTLGWTICNPYPYGCKAGSFGPTAAAARFHVAVSSIL